jgi:hypothetical protein
MLQPHTSHVLFCTPYMVGCMYVGATSMAVGGHSSRPPYRHSHTLTQSYTLSSARTHPRNTVHCRRATDECTCDGAFGVRPHRILLDVCAACTQTTPSTRPTRPTLDDLRTVCYQHLFPYTPHFEKQFTLDAQRNKQLCARYVNIVARIIHPPLYGTTKLRANDPGTPDTHVECVLISSN